MSARNRFRWGCAGASALALCLCIPVLAAVDQAPPRGVLPADGPSLTPTLVKTGLYEISGAGANSLVRFSGSGQIVVDGGTAGSYRALMSQVRRLSRLSDLPVQFLILTNHFSNRSANTAQFAGRGVRIIAHENAARRLSNGRPGVDTGIVPVLTYETSHPLRVGGVQMNLYHFGHARTDGDTVVDFTNLKIVAVGDLVAKQPDPDFRSGGSLVGWPAVLARILTLDFDTAIPSTGPALSRHEVEAFKARIETVIARASALVKRGLPKEQLMAQLKTEDMGWHFSFSGADLDAFYAELSRAAN
jgi:glyoxylase-like metal-dependent hydrolase (beta-lactamase superfamily II)